MSVVTDPSSAPPVEGEILTTRLFDASREEVFGAFSDPACLARWWGPNGFTNTFREFDLRPGGEWRFSMYGPDGAEYPNVSKFLEVDAPGRIVFEHQEPGHWYRMTMLIEEEAGQTRLTWRMLFEPEEAARIGQFVAAANEENFDRLEAQLRASR